MNPGWIDYLVLVFVALGALRGWRRGAVDELQALFATALLLGALSGLVSVAHIRHGIQAVVADNRLLSGVLGSVAAFVATFWLLRGLRTRVPDWLAGGLAGGPSARVGMLAGALRRALLALFVLVLATGLAPGFLLRYLQDHSLAGRWLAGLVPGL